MSRPLSLRLPIGLGCACLFSSAASAQTITELLKEGDPVPGNPSELITSFDNVDINGSGDWLVELNSDSTVNDQYVIHNGAIYWQEGTATGFTPPAGYEASSFVDTMDINDNGDIMLISPLRLSGTTSTSKYVLLRNGKLLVESDVTPVDPALGLPAGTVYTGVAEAWQNNSDQILFAGNVFVAGSSLDILVRFDLDLSGDIGTTTMIAMEGQTLSAPSHVTPIQGFSFSKPRNGINDNGDYWWYVDDDHTTPPGSTLSDSSMYINQTQLYNEADAFPAAPNEVFDHFSTAEMDMNDSGDYVLACFDRRTDSSADSWIFKSIGGVIEVIAHESDPVPAYIPGPWLVAGFGFGGNVPISDNGDVLWYLDWDDPDTTVDSALIFNQTPLLFEGVSVLSGLVVDTVPDGADEIAMSDDGALAIGEVLLEGSIDGVFLFELPNGFGDPICDPAEINSTGQPGILGAFGSSSAATDNFVLTGEQLPDGQFAMFLACRTDGFIANPSGSMGNLCLVGPTARFNQGGLFGQVSGGVFSRQIPLTGVPEPPTFNVDILPGETWFFQLWHRDFVMGSPTSNFTNALEVLFQ